MRGAAAQNAYLTVEWRTEIGVDDAVGEQLRIAFNASFPLLPCKFIAVDVTDVMGERRMNLSKSIEKWRLQVRAPRGAAPPPLPAPMPNWGCCCGARRAVLTVRLGAGRPRLAAAEAGAGAGRRAAAAGRGGAAAHHVAGARCVPRGPSGGACR